jgi:hypothetical protein
MLYEFRVIGLTIAVLTICGDGQARQSDITKRDERQAVIVTTPEIAAVYKALVSLDEHERNALFRSLSSEAKAALWKTQLSIFLAEQGTLTSDQRAVVSEIARQIEPSLYDRDFTSGVSGISSLVAPKYVEIDQLTRRAAEIFTPDLLDRVLYRLGPSPDEHLARSHGWRFQVNDLCDCSTTYTTCSLCQGGGCTKTQSGCGPMKLNGCNGLCQ